MMIYESWRRERVIRRVLRGIARQRVLRVMQPGNAWLVERALTVDEEVEGALRTCFLRGWVEPISNDPIPHGDAFRVGAATGPLFDGARVIYRLTDSGWNVINNVQAWVVATFVISVASLFASVVGVVVTMGQ